MQQADVHKAELAEVRLRLGAGCHQILKMRYSSRLPGERYAVASV